MSKEVLLQEGGQKVTTLSQFPPFRIFIDFLSSSQFSILGHGPNLAQLGPNLVPTWPQLAPTWPQLRPTWTILAPIGPQLGKSLGSFPLPQHMPQRGLGKSVGIPSKPPRRVGPGHEFRIAPPYQHMSQRGLGKSSEARSKPPRRVCPGQEFRVVVPLRICPNVV